MLSLKLSTGFGEVKNFQNLTEPIRIVIPNKTPVPEPEPSNEAYCSLMKKIHLLPCKVNESVIILQIKPQLNGSEGEGVKLFAFMNNGM